MNHTANFQLNQWESSDRIQMEDFNSDNAKIDTALKETAEAVALCGNCKIVTTSYTGDGATAKDNARSLTFEKAPAAVFIFGEETGFTAPGAVMRILKKGTVAGQNTAQSITEWAEDGTSVSWYDGSLANSMLNTSGSTYLVVILYNTED